MPEVYDQLSEQMLGQLRGQATAMSPARIDARLLELAGYPHPSARQRSERDILAEAQLAHKNLMVAIAAQGGVQAFADGRAGERVGGSSRPANAGLPPAGHGGWITASHDPNLQQHRSNAMRILDRYSKSGHLSARAADGLDEMVRERDQAGIGAQIFGRGRRPLLQLGVRQVVEGSDDRASASQR